MSKHVQLASYYLNDKDLSDLFAAQNVSKRALLKIARSRGIFLSEKSTVEDIRGYLSTQPFGWNEVNAIISRMNKEQNITKEMTTQVLGTIDFNAIPGALDKVATERSQKREVPTATRLDENTFRIDVSYIEFEPHNTRSLQRVEKKVSIEIEQSKGCLDIRYSGVDRCAEIVRHIVRNLPYTSDEEKSQRIISLRDVNDPARRTKFFLDLIQGLEGFLLADVKEVHMDRRLPSDDSDDEETEQEGSSEDDSEPSAEEEELQGLVKKAALTGEGIHTTKLYEDLRKSGYYITSIVWSAKELKGDARVIEFYAGFEEPVYALDFVYSIRRVFKTDSGKRKRTAERHQPIDKTALLKAARASAYAAFATVEAELVKT